MTRCGHLEGENNAFGRPIGEDPDGTFSFPSDPRQLNGVKCA